MSVAPPRRYARRFVAMCARVFNVPAHSLPTYEAWLKDNKHEYNKTGLGGNHFVGIASARDQAREAREQAYRLTQHSAAGTPDQTTSERHNQRDHKAEPDTVWSNVVVEGPADALRSTGDTGDTGDQLHRQGGTRGDMGQPLRGFHRLDSESYGTDTI